MTEPSIRPPLNPIRASSARAIVESRFPSAYGRLSYTARVLAENLVRKNPPAIWEPALDQVIGNRRDADIPFFPARVVLQDLLGTPALVDLAGLRDAVAERGADPRRVDAVVPTHLVVDHSLNVDADGAIEDALLRNMRIESSRNAERFEFLAWAKRAFRNVHVVMPGHGILHQINLEHLSPVVVMQGDLAFPDTLVGTDSHTPMINALGVLGWGVGGIEAESVMLGRPIRMRMPSIVAVELTGRRRSGVQATDLVLALTRFLRSEGVVDTILEFRGEGAAALPLADRATISNMAPEFGATAAIFAIDERTIEFLRLTGRRPAHVDAVERYARSEGLWADSLTDAHFSRVLRFDISTVGRAIAGPAQPDQLLSLTELSTHGIAASPQGAVPSLAADSLADGAVVIAAITSCTNTSNPRSVIAAGLVARNAVARGLRSRSWVKTSFAPGSKAVERYLEDAALLAPLRSLGFGIVGFGCTSCNGMSGPLPEAVERQIVVRRLRTAAVLSGNRNFKGRIHPHVTDAYLASPALTVIYALAGSMRVDIARDPIALDRDGREVRVDELWPSDEEIDEQVRRHVGRTAFQVAYDDLYAGSGDSQDASAGTLRFPWSDSSNYIRRPPYWDVALNSPGRFRNMRALAILGDNVTTDDLSPSGAILPDSAAGRYLIARGVSPEDFNSYGTRRGDHEVAMRATFANHRLKNEMSPAEEGSMTRLEPDGTLMPLFEAAQVYARRHEELVVIAGKNYGCGSSRDWAAKGIRLLGVRAVICESFERIHRSNLVAVGVLPLEFSPGFSRESLGLDGSETFTLEGLEQGAEPGADTTLAIRRRDGHESRAVLKCRIDTEEEQRIFAAGGLLRRISQEILAPDSGGAAA